eukprot:scaffold28259_cov107-Isochrysis_galbana.AAC.1
MIPGIGDRIVIFLSHVVRLALDVNGSTARSSSSSSRRVSRFTPSSSSSHPAAAKALGVSSSAPPPGENVIRDDGRAFAFAAAASHREKESTCYVPETSTRCFA